SRGAKVHWPFKRIHRLEKERGLLSRFGYEAVASPRIPIHRTNCQATAGRPQAAVRCGQNGGRCSTVFGSVVSEDSHPMAFPLRGVAPPKRAAGRYLVSVCDCGKMQVPALCVEI